MRTVLQFSGGKDSLALVWYLQSLWDMIMIIHVDSGDMYDSAREVVADIEQRVPHFARLQMNSPGYRKNNGDPTNENWTKCCTANIWWPMATWCRQNGVRQILRASKSCDPYFHGVMPGDIVDGILYTMPIWDWTEVSVRDFLGDKLPDAYKRGAKAMPDCKGCTASAACGMSEKPFWEVEHAAT